MAANPQPRLTEEQYLVIERAAEFRSEYHDGVMYLMAGTSRWHAIITGNFTRELGNALKKQPCVVMPTDMRVRVKPGRTYVYPDVVIACEPSKYADKEQDTLLNPTLVVEVLSPSTEAHDRGLKSARYREMESLNEYALVSQTEARVEVYRRHGSGQWLLSEFVGLDAVAEFGALPGGPIHIPMAEIYAKVEFEGPGDLASADVA